MLTGVDPHPLDPYNLLDMGLPHHRDQGRTGGRSGAALIAALVVGATACGGAAPPTVERTRAYGRRHGHLPMWREVSRGDRAEVGLLRGIVPETVMARARLATVAGGEGTSPRTDRWGGRHLELLEWDFALRTLLPRILDAASSPELVDLASRLRRLPAIRSEEALSTAADTLALPHPGDDPVWRVESSWSAGRVSPDDLAWTALAAMESTIALEQPNPLLCLSGAPVLLTGLPPAFLVYFAVATGVPLGELDRDVAALLARIQAEGAPG